MSDLKAYYGLRKLTKKAVRKPAIVVVFENDYSSKNIKRMEQMMKILHVRQQTQEEKSDAQKSNRMFTVYEMFLEDKKYRNDPENVIKYNSLADKNHVSQNERLEIEEKFRREIYRFYGLKKQPKKQLELFDI